MKPLLPAVDLYQTIKVARELEVQPPAEAPHPMFEKLRARAGTDIRIDPKLPKNTGYFSFVGDKHIGLPDEQNYRALAHEIGHAQQEGTLFGGLTQNRLARGLSTYSPYAGAFLPLALPNNTPLLSRTLLSAATQGALNAPTLANETMANYNAYQLLKDEGASEEDLKNYLNQAAKWQSTYLIAPTVGTALGMLPGRLPASPKYASAVVNQTKFRDLGVSVEFNPGSYRHWKDPKGKEGKTLMRYPYGHINRTRGMDGEEVDCFVGPNKDSPNVYVVTTNKPPGFDVPDEQKVMLGFSNASEARRSFQQHYDDPKFYREMRTFPYDEFKKKVLETATGGPRKLATLRSGVCR